MNSRTSSVSGTFKSIAGQSVCARIIFAESVHMLCNPRSLIHYLGCGNHALSAEEFLLRMTVPVHIISVSTSCLITVIRLKFMPRDLSLLALYISYASSLLVEYREEKAPKQTMRVSKGDKICSKTGPSICGWSSLMIHGPNANLEDRIVIRTAIDLASKFAA